MSLLTEPVGVTHYLVVGAVMFVAGAVCMATKRNALGVLMGIEPVSDAQSVFTTVQNLISSEGDPLLVQAQIREELEKKCV